MNVDFIVENRIFPQKNFKGKKIKIMVIWTCGQTWTSLWIHINFWLLPIVKKITFIIFIGTILIIFICVNFSIRWRGDSVSSLSTVHLISRSAEVATWSCERCFISRSWVLYTWGTVFIHLSFFYLLMYFFYDA